MRSSLPTLLLTLLSTSSTTVAQLQPPSSPQQWPLHSNNLSQAVQWDHYSLIVNGERLFMWSGEIHYWRLPVPELWEDVLQKVKVWLHHFPP